MKKYNLRKLVKKALTCNPKCGHGMDWEKCFEHQVDRVKELIEVEADSWEVSRPFGVLPVGWRTGQTIFNFLEFLKQNKGYAPNQTPRLADCFYIPDEEFEKLYKEFLSEHEGKTDFNPSLSLNKRNQ